MLLNPYRFATGDSDPYWANVVLLMHMDGSNGSTTFTDQKGHTVTANGNAQISTAQSKFGGAALLLDGTGDYLSLAASSDWSFSTGDFTVEAWVYIAGNSALDGSSRRTAIITSVASASVFTGVIHILGDSTTTGTGLSLYDGTNTVSVTGAISQNAWHHIAVCRSGTSLRFFLDGTQMGATQTYSASFGDATNALKIGGSTITSYNMVLNGYLDEIRITKGYARYTSNFTVPSAAFPNQ